jgi:hypothetical protein
MFKHRRRFKQTLSLEDRLTAEAQRLRQEAKAMPLGIERSQLLRRAREAETASRISEWLRSPGLRPPN